MYAYIQFGILLPLPHLKYINSLKLSLKTLVSLRVENFPAVGHLECPVPSWITAQMKSFAQSPLHTLDHWIDFQK